MRGIRACPLYSTSGNGSTVASNCTCDVGYDIGDGQTRTVYSIDDACSLTMEVRITTMQAAAASNASNASGCLSKNSSILEEYCDANAGTRDDVWVRVQWDTMPRVWSSWYALYRDIVYDFEVPVEPGRGFDFSAGGEAVALLTGIPGDVLASPVAIEYYISGPDAWRPASLEVRFPHGVPRFGIGDAAFKTHGPLCWVDLDGEGVEQSALGCAFVEQIANASLVAHV